MQDKYIAIQELHTDQAFPIALLCEIAAIARSSYYKWLQRIPSAKELLNQEILVEIKRLYKEVDGIYGYRQMTLHVNRKCSQDINHKRVYRLMRLSGIQAVIRKKKKRYVSSVPQQVAENILNREFTADQPNQKWVTDVTELKYSHSQKAYLSAIRDLFDGSIVSYVLGHSNNNALVFDTLDKALNAAPGATPLIHSDRGFQYTSKEFKRKLDAATMTQSMSRVGKCIDNGPIESFWGTLKCEKYYLNKYNNYDDLAKAIDEYIFFYNHKRLQKRLNGLSPMEFRTKAV